MKLIKYFDDESYVDDILSIINEFESFEYISKQLKEIIKTIDGNIKEIVFYNSDKLYPKLEIKLHGFNQYVFNYDGKNYGLFTFRTEYLIIHGSDTIIEFGDDCYVNLSEFEFKNFCIIE